MTPEQHAAKNDYWITRKGITVTLWRPARTIPGGTPTEQPPTSLGETPALILQGADAAQQATLAGLDPNQAAECFFPSSLAGTVAMGLYLEDPAGVWWRIQSAPDVQRASAPGVVIGVSVLLIQQSQRPAGIA